MHRFNLFSFAAFIFFFEILLSFLFLFFSSFFFFFYKYIPVCLYLYYFLSITMAPLLCCCCQVVVEEHKSLRCCICKKIFNHTCIDITVSEIRIMKSKRGFTWTCGSCDSLGNDISDLKAVILQLKNEVADLKARSSDLQPVIEEDMFEELVQEMQERESRKTNFILYGAVEGSGASGAAHREADADVVKNILTKMAINSKFSVFRLGKFNAASPRPRPIRVSLESGQLVRSVVFAAMKLTSDPAFKDLRVSFDRTPRQQQHYNKLRSAVKERVAGGESVRIKHVRGVPKIVSVDLN